MPFGLCRPDVVPCRAGPAHWPSIHMGVGASGSTQTEEQERSRGEKRDQMVSMDKVRGRTGSSSAQQNENKKENDKIRGEKKKFLISKQFVCGRLYFKKARELDVKISEACKFDVKNQNFSLFNPTKQMHMKSPSALTKYARTVGTSTSQVEARLIQILR